MNETPLYRSKRTLKSLGQEYRIYPDRLELQSWLLFIPSSCREMKFRMSKFVRPLSVGKGITWGIKIDNAICANTSC